MIEIRGITICVGYDDLLKITLPRNMRHMSECLVVTSPDDQRTKDLALSVPGVRVFETDAFTRYGARFNKGLAMEEGFDALGREGWILIWDADILLPEEFPYDRVKPECLHGMRRRFLDDPTKWTPEYDWKLSRWPADPQWIGYFQLFHAGDPKLAGVRPWYDVTFAHAGGADAYFITHWQSPWRQSLKADVLHLGPKDTNWFGRASARLDDLPNDAARERKDVMDAFIHRNGWEATHPQADRTASQRVGRIVERVRVPGYPESNYELPFVRRARAREQE